MKRLASVLILAVLSATATAGEFYGGLGTTGLNVGYTHGISETFGVRAEGNYLNYGKDVNSDGVNYDAKVKMEHLGVYVDYHPFGGNMRLTAGVLLGNDRFTGTAKGNAGTVNINGTDYNLSGESLKLDAKFPSTRPYLGIGYGHSVSKGLGMFFDVGVAYGKPKASLTASQGLATAAGDANIEAEKRKVQDDLDKVKLWPVVKVGLSYAF